MFHKFIVPVLLIAVFVLSACTKDLHGGGRVTLLQVTKDGNPGLLGEAAIGLSFVCSEGKDAIRGVLHWTDNANSVNFTARLPWTPVNEIFGVATCAEARAIANDAGASVNLAVINTQGQPTGMAIVGVGEPGVSPDCGAESPVVVAADFDSNGGAEDYQASGCLDRGKIVFQ